MCDVISCSSRTDKTHLGLEGVFQPLEKVLKQPLRNIGGAKVELLRRGWTGWGVALEWGPGSSGCDPGQHKLKQASSGGCCSTTRPDARKAVSGTVSLMNAFAACFILTGRAEVMPPP